VAAALAQVETASKGIRSAISSHHPYGQTYATEYGPHAKEGVAHLDALLKAAPTTWLDSPIRGTIPEPRVIQGTKGEGLLSGMLKAFFVPDQFEGFSNGTPRRELPGLIGERSTRREAVEALREAFASPPPGAAYQDWSSRLYDVRLAVDLLKAER